MKTIVIASGLRDIIALLFLYSVHFCTLYINKITKMKIFAFALVAFVAGANAALPQLQFPVQEAIRSSEPRLVTNQIEQAIKDVSQAIVDAGLDPFVLDHQSTAYALPVPSIFNYRSSVTGVLFKGASHFAINRLTFGLTLMRLQYDISMPEIRLEIGDSELDFNLFDKNFNGRISGSFIVKNIQTTGTIRFSVGIITGTSIRSIALGVQLGGIQSQMNVKMLGRDYSKSFNNHFQETVPGTFKAFGDDINELLTIIGKELIESLL